MKLVRVDAEKRTVFANPDDPTEPGYGTTEDRDIWRIMLIFEDAKDPQIKRAFGIFLADYMDADKVPDGIELAAKAMREGLNAKPRT